MQLLVLLDVDGTLFLTHDTVSVAAFFDTLASVYGVERPEKTIDRVDHAGQTALRIARLVLQDAGLGDFHAVHPVSAKTGDGIPGLREELVALLPEGPLYFPQEQRTDLPLELQIAELIREKALWLTRDEVPHAVSAEVQELDEKVLRAILLVETDSQKQIVVGKGGALIREIGTRARPEIEQLLGRSIYLDLTVKVRPRWRRDEATLERLGL